MGNESVAHVAEPDMRENCWRPCREQWGFPLEQTNPPLQPMWLLLLELSMSMVATNFQLVLGAMTTPIDDLLNLIAIETGHDRALCGCQFCKLADAARRVREWRSSGLLTDAELLTAYNDGAGPVEAPNDHECGLRAVERAVRERVKA